MHVYLLYLTIASTSFQVKWDLVRQCSAIFLEPSQGFYLRRRLDGYSERGKSASFVRWWWRFLSRQYPYLRIIQRVEKADNTARFFGGEKSLNCVSVILPESLSIWYLPKCPASLLSCFVVRFAVHDFCFVRFLTATQWTDYTGQHDTDNFIWVI